MRSEEIINALPYKAPFLFVDEIEEVTEQGVLGYYTFHPSHTFYQGHFKENPITPGVILTECCAQIGLVCLGIHLLIQSNSLSELSKLKLGMSSSEMEFYQPVFPGERVRVVSEKIYFRFHKLKCKVRMFDQNDQLVCKGEIAGMFKMDKDA